MDISEKTKNINRHPWELSRSHNVLKLLQHINNNAVYADIGAGDRFFTSKLLYITEGNVFAIDNGYSNSSGKEGRVICLNDISLLKNNCIDCLIMMDVLEHIENEKLFLKAVLEKLRPNGDIIITVPAMRFLFSFHDVFLKHYRRYNRKQLFDLLLLNEIKIEQSYYFYTTLFVVRFFVSLIEKIFQTKKQNFGIGLWGHSEKSFITRFFVIMLNMDFFLNKLLSKIFIRLPGLSLLAVGKKKS